MAVTCWCAACDRLVDKAQPVDGKLGDPDHIIATCHGQHDSQPFNDYSGIIRFFESSKKRQGKAGKESGAQRRFKEG